MANSILRLHRAAQYNAQEARRDNLIGRRLACARHDRGLSLQKFSQLLEDYGVSVSHVAIHKWEQGISSPNAYQLLAIAQALGFGGDLSWFLPAEAEALNAEGLKKLSDYRTDLIASGRYQPQREAPSTIAYKEMPVSTLPVSAGPGAFLDEEQFEMIAFPEHTIPAGADFGVRISGDSMEPVYHHGQIVWVRQCDRVKVGDVGIFICDGEGYLKVYDEAEPPQDCREDYITSDGVLRSVPIMRSYNPAYPPKVISPCAEFSIVGQVL